MREYIKRLITADLRRLVCVSVPLVGGKSVGNTDLVYNAEYFCLFGRAVYRLIGNASWRYLCVALCGCG